jgi:adenine-specific DNA-methyltransferase
MNKKTFGSSSAKNKSGPNTAPQCDFASVNELLAAALSLVPRSTLTPAEKAATKGIKASVDSTRLDSVVARIRAGEDPLGRAYCQIRNSAARRDKGQTFTPPNVVTTMLEWARAQRREISRIVDPGAGSGRYTVAALKAFPQARTVAVEIDPVVALVLRANLEANGLSARCEVIVDDYRDLQLPPIEGSTLFIGNPPYVRHHQISTEWKRWYSTELKAQGAHGSQLAGLHLHFFLKTCALARPQDIGCFITAAEWLDAGYGSALRELLAGPLGGVAVFLARPELKLFEDALASGAITAFAPGTTPTHIRFSRFSSLPNARNLRDGRKVAISEARASMSWSALFKKRAAKPSIGQVELGEFFRISRGQLTGQNAVWIQNPETPELPARFLIPTITKASDIIGATNSVIDKTRALKRVISLPRDLKSLEPAERAQVETFIIWARAQGADKTYTATHRSPWHRVQLHEPPPIVMTYMGRRPPVFARNEARFPLLNIALGLFPKSPHSKRKLAALIAWLNANVDAASGRLYAGGLIKFEPSVAMKLKIPRHLLGSDI